MLASARRRRFRRREVLFHRGDPGDVRRQNAHLVDAYFASAERRVVRRLVEISDRLPETGGLCTVHLTQEDLAALAGTTRPTANKVLRELERAGALALHRGRIEVLDRDRLAARAR